MSVARKVHPGATPGALAATTVANLWRPDFGGWVPHVTIHYRGQRMLNAEETEAIGAIVLAARARIDAELESR